MRVCFVCPHAASVLDPSLPAVHGGAEVQLTWFAKELARRRRVEVHFVIDGEDGRSSLTQEGIVLHHYNHRSGLAQKWRFQRLLSSIHADVFLQRAYGSLTKEIAFFCLRNPARFVYWIAHDNDLRSSWKGGLARGLFRWAVRRADVIIAQTEFQSAQLRQSGVDKSVLIRNASPPRDPSIEERTTLLWIGRFVPFKRPELFLDIARLFPNTPCRMVAPVVGEQARCHYERYCEEIESISNLEFIPGVPLAATNAYFDQAQALVLTSVAEGYPNTMMQAMWSGTPITAFGCDPDGVIERERLGVHEAEDWCGFIDRLQKALNNTPYLHECGRRAYELASENHDISRNVEILEDLVMQTDRV